jgi:hypothetical protein
VSSRGPVRVWHAPIALGVVTAIGLTAALLSESIGDVFAWIALALPIAIVLWYAPRRTEK